MEQLEKQIKELVDKLAKEIQLEASLVGTDHIITDSSRGRTASAIHLSELSIWFNKVSAIELEIENNVFRIENEKLPSLLLKLIQAYALNGENYIKPS